jgi:hypothetical protein
VWYSPFFGVPFPHLDKKNFTLKRLKFQKKITYKSIGSKREENFIILFKRNFKYSFLFFRLLLIRLNYFQSVDTFSFVFNIFFSKFFFWVLDGISNELINK